MIKLISCHIENFGVISNTDIEFNGGLTEIIKENGYGKTTIASFIRAMFFGLPSTRSNDKELGLRQRYYPFNNQKFGGSLTFEKNGKKYIVERFFDKKSDTKDEVKLYEDLKQVKDANEYLGDNLFGIDEDAFLRTIFITSEQIDIISTSNISAKLNNIIENTDDDNNFDSAYKIVEDVQKEYKMRGDKGKIKDKKQEILNLKEEIANFESIKNSLNLKYYELKQVESQMLDLKDKFEKSNQDIAVIENFKTYDGMLNELKNQEDALNNLKNNFKNGIPSKEDLTILQETTTKAYEQSQKVAILKNDNISDRFNKVASQFNSGVPSEEELLNVSKNITNLRTLASNVPTNKQQKSPILTIVSLIVTLVGVGVAFASLIAGLTIAVVGCVGAVIGLLTGVKSNANTSNEKEILAVKESLNVFFATFGYTGENYEDNLADLRTKVNLYSVLGSEVEGKNQTISKEEEILNGYLISIKEKVSALGFDISVNLKNTVDNIVKCYDNYLRQNERCLELLKKVEDFKRDKNLTERPQISELEIRQNTTKLNETQNEYYKLLKIIEDDEKTVENLNLLYSQLSKAEEEFETLKEEYDIYTKTLEFLSLAKENLQQKYVAPIKDRFNYYSLKLEKALNQKTYMDRDFKISYESNGELHSQKHLSLGQTAMCNLCIRLALIDNMFTSDIPFVILDDPFIGLDETNFKNMQKLINELAKDRQIIYFTCHESRKIS